MSKNKHIYFLGYSGHAYVAIDVANSSGYYVKGYFDQQENKENPYDIQYFGNEANIDLKDFVNDCYVFPAMGSNTIRKRLHTLLKQLNIKQLVLAHPTAFISDTAVIGESSLINPNVSINALARIGKACIINTGSIIEHECQIGNYSHIAPGAVLAGNVKIGENCFVGARAVIKQGVSIADNVIVGAGSVVLNNIDRKGTWVGNPAKQLIK
ncbi:acetyltransferase [Maribacter sp. SA7]|uniref:acetyltransferase n=1 Tax=Maribacter zhoushanensis TaxID=3030012 RepID=UPI0023EA7A64|nr:acetyltransferase [Maribacter zhoushanensis]MDF4201479.1 acetyltransferase [Maribacter zhoushanensis]